MSYSGRSRFGVHGLGADTPAEQVRAATTYEHTDYGQPWMFIGVRSPEYRQLVTAKNWRGPTGVDNDGHARSEMGTALGVKAAWLRFGMVPAWWIDNIDAHVTEDWGRVVRVHKQLLDVIKTGGRFGKDALWAVAPDGFVRLLGGSAENQRDSTIDMIVAKLLAGGYLPPLREGETVATRTNGYFDSGHGIMGGASGPLVGDTNPRTGLRSAWDDISSAIGTSATFGGRRLPSPGHWPTDIDFSAAVGRELRVHPDFLSILMTAVLPGELRALRARTAGLRTRRIVGGFPRVGGRR